MVLYRPPPVTSVAFTPKNPVLASSDESAVIKLWDVATGRELRTLSGHSPAGGRERAGRNHSQGGA
jgi:WD40 repeat protein